MDMYIHARCSAQLSSAQLYSELNWMASHIAFPLENGTIHFALLQRRNHFLIQLN